MRGRLTTPAQSTAHNTVTERKNYLGRSAEYWRKQSEAVSPAAGDNKPAKVSNNPVENELNEATSNSGPRTIREYANFLGAYSNPMRRPVNNSR